MRLRLLKMTRITPIHEFPSSVPGVRLYIKRDDLNGLLISGNKARKMEYLIADAHQQGCDTLITCGPHQSNHCRTAAAFARSFRLDCHLFLRWRPGSAITGNLLLDRLLAARVHYLTPAQYARRMEIMARYGRTLRGKKPYIIPEGGSNEIGCLGYLDAMKEMAGFIKRQRIQALYCAVGSGGTYAGLLLGKKILGLDIDLNGVIICDTVAYFKNKIMAICETAIRRFRLKAEIEPPDLNLIPGFVGQGYGIPYPAAIRTIQRTARHGIILEPVYTGKAFYGMETHLRNHKYRRVLFLHTGGIFSVFAFARELTGHAGAKGH